MPEIKLSQGTIHYREQGGGASGPGVGGPAPGVGRPEVVGPDPGGPGAGGPGAGGPGAGGPAILFVHGLLVNGTIWDQTIMQLAQHARCIVPDLPLGSHKIPMDPAADLTPPGLAALLAELITSLGLEDVTLVGNDTGGALCQLATAANPTLVGRLVLTNCDSFEHFPPRAFKPLVSAIARVPGLTAATAALATLRPVRKASMAAASLTVDPIPDELIRSWVEPLRNPDVRKDLVKVARGIDPRHTIAAAEQLRTYSRPVLLAWGTRDKFFPLAHAERLQSLFPDGRLEKIDNARTFVPLDAPDRLAELITAFAATPASQQS